MRLLLVVQRYGTEVPGGAETAARMLAERMALAGHEVSVVSSCAVDYATWQDELDPGTTVERGVEVTRLPVVGPRVAGRFDPLSARVFGTRRPSPVVQAAWMFEQGPILQRFGDELVRRSAAVDAVAFMTYLYPTTVHGLPAVAPFVPTVLHPTAHEEAPFRLPVMRTAVDHASGMAYFSQEERRLVELRCRPVSPAGLVPLGIDVPAMPTDAAAFRARYGLGDDPYLLFLGRIDPNKGAAELLDMFAARRGAEPRLRLVLMGAEMMTVGDRPGVVVTGFVDEATKWGALSGALALVQPSRQESFSIALAEAWSVGVPVLVQDACDVLAGFTRRAGGGLGYRDQADFDTAVAMLAEDASLRAALGASGRRHVADVLSWPAVVAAYEDVLGRAIAYHHDRRAAQALSPSLRP